MDVSELKLHPDVRQGDRQYTAVITVYDEIMSHLAKLKIMKAREAKQRLVERIAAIGECNTAKDRTLNQKLSRFKESVDFNLLDQYLEVGERFHNTLADMEKDVGERKCMMLDASTHLAKTSKT